MFCWGFKHPFGGAGFLIPSAVCLIVKCLGFEWDSSQWPFQKPKLEVPTIYKAYVSGLCKRISPQNMAKNMVRTYIQENKDPEDLPLISGYNQYIGLWNNTQYMKASRITQLIINQQRYLAATAPTMTCHRGAPRDLVVEPHLHTATSARGPTPGARRRRGPIADPLSPTLHGRPSPKTHHLCSG